jgi:hypothetical protein
MGRRLKLEIGNWKLEHRRVGLRERSSQDAAEGGLKPAPTKG